MKTLLLTLCFVMSLATLAIADEAADTRPAHSLFGVPIHPYGALTLSRPFDLDGFSTGFKVGAEVDLKPVWIGLEVRLHDILTEAEAEVYPFNGEFEISLGGYW